MELLHRSSGLKQRMVAERLGGLDEGLVSRDRRAIREKIETGSKIRKWFQDFTTLSTYAMQPKKAVNDKVSVTRRVRRVILQQTER
jgi:hypothetical protein